jgi:hypothetical protein
MADRMRFLTAAAYGFILITSLFVAARFGASPQSKLTIFLVCCLIWYVVLGWVRQEWVK